ncbi:unnamed protein product [Ambrosiozyma monospora]|uniref:Unnamed protein product n=1 Tax=Ambrosiozyma monospora TaxID=43982 RepID=A0ACB5T1Z8_AMBMO|nr:unnamed protein product [Ambrosiozyma monospora]
MSKIFSSILRTGLRASSLLQTTPQTAFTAIRCLSTVQPTDPVSPPPPAPAAVRNLVKPEGSRKTYLMDIYKHFWENNEIVLFAHHNNLLATDNEKIRKQLLHAGADYRKVKNTIFKHYLRASNHPDPASKAATRQIKRNRIRHPLESLLKGPTALILIKDLNPKTVKEVLKVLKSQNEKLFLMGGRIGADVSAVDKIQEFQDLKSLPELHAELTGILTMLSGAGLVRTLESASNMLYLTLDAHKTEMAKPAEGENAPADGESK